MSTPIILPVKKLTSFKTLSPGIGSDIPIRPPPNSSFIPSTSCISSTKFSIKLPSITLPAAPSPSPPKNSTLGGPHSNTFPVLHSIGSLDSPSSDPKIPHDPMFCSNLDKEVLIPATAD